MAGDEALSPMQREHARSKAEARLDRLDFLPLLRLNDKDSAATCPPDEA